MNNYLRNPAYAAFMQPKKQQQYETEAYVAVPPALIITDASNAVWTLGFQTAPKDKTPNGEFAYDVLRNGVPVGESASRIEYRAQRVRIFTRDGWKRWTGFSFV